MRRLILLLLAVGGFCFSAYADEIAKKVNISLGSQLVELAKASTQYSAAGYTEPPDNYAEEETFLIYPILGANEGFSAHFAVNPWTGDVWDMDECKRLSNSALLKAQAKIKTQFHGDEFKEYARLGSLKPYRMYDLEPCP